MLLVLPYGRARLHQKAFPLFSARCGTRVNRCFKLGKKAAVRFPCLSLSQRSVTTRLFSCHLPAGSRGERGGAAGGNEGKEKGKGGGGGSEAWLLLSRTTVITVTLLLFCTPKGKWRGAGDGRGRTLGVGSVVYLQQQRSRRHSAVLLSTPMFFCRFAGGRGRGREQQQEQDFIVGIAHSNVVGVYVKRRCIRGEVVSRFSYYFFRFADFQFAGSRCFLRFVLHLFGTARTFRDRL